MPAPRRAVMWPEAGELVGGWGRVVVLIARQDCPTLSHRLYNAADDDDSDAADVGLSLPPDLSRQTRLSEG